MFRMLLSSVLLVVLLVPSGNAAKAEYLAPEQIANTSESDVFNTHPERTAERTVDESGLWGTGNIYHNRSGGNMWLTDFNPPCPTSPSGRSGAKAWVYYEFDDVYALGRMWVWNNNDSNDGADAYTVRGLKDVTIDYSVNGTDWTELGGGYVFEQAPAPATDDYVGFAGPDFGWVSAKYVVITAWSNWGPEPWDPNMRAYSLSEVKFEILGCFTSVTPAAPQASRAVQNQAADPPSFTYTFENSGTEAISSYTVEETNEDGTSPVDYAWLSLDDTEGGGGSIPIGSVVHVIANITDTSMPYEIYTAYVTFTDDCDPDNQHIRRIDLTIGGPLPTDITGPFIPEANFANVTVSDVFDADTDRDGWRTVDFSGLNEDLEHSTDGRRMWLTDFDPPCPEPPSGPDAQAKAWIAYEFDQVFQLGRSRIWNNNDSPSGGNEYTVRGLKNVTVHYSVDGQAWDELGDYVFELGSGSSDYIGFTGPDFGGVSAKYVVMTASSNWGPDPDFGGDMYSLSEVKFEVIGCFSSVTPVDPQTCTALRKLAPDRSSITYTFQNNGTVDFTSYTVAETNAAGSAPVDYTWLSLDDSEGNGGAIPAGQSVPVIANITSTDLAPGTHSAYVTFTDDCTTPNQHIRRIDLVIETTGFIPPAHFANVTVSDYYEDRSGYRTIDESGLNEAGQHDYHGENMWLTNEYLGPPSTTSPSGRAGVAWIAYEFDQVFRLEQMWVWNNNDSNDDEDVYTVRGLKDVTVDYSTDGATWTPLGAYEFEQAAAPATNEYVGFAGPDFGAAPAKYVVITATSNWGEEPYDPGGNRRRYSLSEVKFAISPCSFPFADADKDGDVDQEDFAVLQRCFTGLGDPGGTYDGAACGCFDREEPPDNDVDEADFGKFEDCATGPGIKWSQGLTPDCIP